MARYKLSELAAADLERITEYTALVHGPSQAVLYNTQLHNSAQMVADFPSFGRSYTTRNGSVFQRFNSGLHALFFRPSEGGIIIARILHLKMDFDRHLDF